MPELLGIVAKVEGLDEEIECCVIVKTISKFRPFYFFIEMTHWLKAGNFFPGKPFSL